MKDLKFKHALNIAYALDVTKEYTLRKFDFISVNMCEYCGSEVYELDDLFYAMTSIREGSMHLCPRYFHTLNIENMLHEVLFSKMFKFATNNYDGNILLEVSKMWMEEDCED